MLKNSDLYDELRKVEEVISDVRAKNPVEAAKLKLQVLTVKLLHNIRSNTVTVMKHLGVEMVQSKRRTDETQE